MDYAYTRLRTADRDFGAAYQELRENDYAALGPARVWGAFAGLFGIGSNEMVIVTAGEVDGVDQALRNIPRIAETETTFLAPTVRPETFERRTAAGLYVFRFFDVRFDDVDEIASLSQHAWTHFEDTPDYQAVPQALFREQADGATHGVMLLCTWYDGLNSWQRSRTPAPEATDNFRRRHALTSGTIAFATRLLDEGH